MKCDRCVAHEGGAMKLHLLIDRGDDVAMFYDRYLRLWTAYRIDANQHQSAGAGYGVTPDDALIEAHIAPAYDYAY
jgi:hypothetical protein